MVREWKFYSINRKEPKRRSHRSLSHLMNRRSVDSMQPAQQPTLVGLGVEPAFLSDLTLAPTTPTLVPTPLMNQTIHSLVDSLTPLSLTSVDLFKKLIYFV